MRWATPFFLLAFLGLSAYGSWRGDAIARVLLALQGLFYGAALAGLVPALRKAAPVKIAYFFSEANAAIFAAWIKYLRGERIRVWQPSRR
jgi:hypothetical protein